MRKTQSARISNVRRIRAILWICLLVLMGLFLSNRKARADEIYCYTGNHFTTADGVYSANDSASGCITLTAPLPSDFEGPISNAEIVSFQFQDGHQTISGVESGADAIRMGTSGGVITNWDFFLHNNDSSSLSYIISYKPSEDAERFSLDLGTTDAEHQNTGSIYGMPGTWTARAVPTPEASSLILVVAGVRALAVLKKRIRKSEDTF